MVSQTLGKALIPVFLSDDFVKLGDFGLSKDMGTSAFTSTYVGVSASHLSQADDRPLYTCHLRF